MAFQLPELPYDVKALEPHIDAETMTIHHNKHHKTYVDKLNAALEGKSDLQNRSVEDLLRHLHDLPEDIRTAVRNHGGGHANHSLFWQTLSPTASTPEGPLQAALASTFHSLEECTKALETAALSVFGSGWAWLVLNNGTLAVTTTPNQDSPLLSGVTPLFGIDVWEHAYYLKYQNRRPDYIAALWNIVNWSFVGKRYEDALKGEA